MGNNIDLTKYGAPKVIACGKCKNTMETNFDDFDVDCETSLNLECEKCGAEIKFGIDRVEDPASFEASITKAILGAKSLFSWWDICGVLLKLTKIAEFYANVEEMKFINEQSNKKDG